MDLVSPIIFIRTGDTDLALRLVRVLNQHGISGFWVTTEESEKLQQVWQLDTLLDTFKHPSYNILRHSQTAVMEITLGTQPCVELPR